MTPKYCTNRCYDKDPVQTNVECSEHYEQDCTCYNNLDNIDDYCVLSDGNVCTGEDSECRRYTCNGCWTPWNTRNDR